MNEWMKSNQINNDVDNEEEEEVSGIQTQSA